jgi:hypothetical protein
MAQSARIFIDFWNFALNWRDRSGGLDCDWKKLPGELLAQGTMILKSVGLDHPLDLNETLVYASVKPSEVKLKGWLQNFLDRQPSVRVKIRERRTRTGGIWCNVCKKNIETCPHCNTPFERAPEKGIDTAIVTDLLSLALGGSLRPCHLGNERCRLHSSRREGPRARFEGHQRDLGGPRLRSCSHLLGSVRPRPVHRHTNAASGVKTRDTLATALNGIVTLICRPSAEMALVESACRRREEAIAKATNPAISASL